jgi:predicted TIM-barrel fold metal-dependent hydrolase
VGRSRLALAEHIDALKLVDNHVHGYWLSSGDRHRFENGLNEANTEPLASFDSAFDTQLGFAVRAHCAGLLGLPKHADPSAYWERRSQFSESALAGLFLSSAGVTDWLVDTGIPGDLASPAQLAESAGGNAHEVVRLERVAEQAITSADGAGGFDYAAAFGEILACRARTAVATKSVLAYRGGFEGDLSEPSLAEVSVAALRWRDSGQVRLTDRVLIRFGLHQALRLGLPLQLHVGFGDRDCDLHRTNPLLLLDFLRASGATPIVLLHCYPYEREAGYLAQAFNNVYLDTGLPVHHLGARAEAFLARTMELAPFRKIMYSSDGFGPPELHFLGASLWRRGICSVTSVFVDRGEWSMADAVRVTELVGRQNALRVYRL